MQRSMRTIGSSLVIAIALLAMTASAAEAEIKPPLLQGVQPAFRCLGNVCGQREITVTSLTTRLWVPKLGAAIVCPTSTYTGALMEKSNVKGSTITKEVKYTGCKVETGAREETSETQHHGRTETKDEPKCTVKGSGAAAGEIIFKNLKSKLAYRPGSEVELLDVFEPEVQPFATLEIEGLECTIKGKLELKGSVIGWIPRHNEEAYVSSVLFETKNWEPGARQRFVRYELVNKETEATLKLGENTAFYEATTQIELEVKKEWGAYLE
jgi:hypothetical protein